MFQKLQKSDERRTRDFTEKQKAANETNLLKVEAA